MSGFGSSGGFYPPHGPITGFMAVVDRDGMHLAATESSAWTPYGGPHPLVGKRFDDYLPPVLAAEMRDCIAQALAASGGIASVLAANDWSIHPMQARYMALDADRVLVLLEAPPDAAPKPPLPVDGRVTIDLPPHPTSVAVARHVLEASCGWLGQRAACDDVALVVSELATNAVIHARTWFRATFLAGDGHATVTVDDQSPGFGPISIPHVDRPGGRGLSVVAHIARQWGVEHYAGGKQVWAEIDVRDQSPSNANR